MQDPDTPRVSDALRPRLAVSSCLLGQAVRYDGGHKRHNWLVDTLGRCVDFVPHCPEVSIGLGIPREPIQLTGDPDHPRARAVYHPDRDMTNQLQADARAVAARLDRVAGYVFKSRSPSCGLYHVAVHAESGEVVHNGRGIYASAIQETRPWLPIEEESRLDDVDLRENFVCRLFTYQRWLSLCAEGLSAQRLLNFHARHKYLLMAHSPAACRRLGQLLSGLRDVDLPALSERYCAGLMKAMAHGAGSSGHVNVLQHIMGYLKRRIGPSDKDELHRAIEAYRLNQVPLAAPVVCLRRHLRSCRDEYIGKQWYLWPYPDELGLRDLL